jgi:fucose permease
MQLAVKPRYVHPTQSPRNLRLSLALVFLGYFTFALVLGTIPALMTTFQEKLSMSLSESALTQFFKDGGYLLLSLLGPMAIMSLGLKPSLVIAFLLTGGGSLMIALQPSDVSYLFAGIFFQGTGFGLGVLSLLAVLTGLKEKYQRLSMLYSLWGLAGFLAPALVAFVLARGFSHQLLYFVYAIAMALLAGLSILTHPSQSETKQTHWNEVAKLFANREIIGFGVTFLLIVACDAIVGTWVTSFVESRYEFSRSQSSSCLSLFWAAYSIGRFFGDTYIGRLGKIRSILVSCLVGAVGLTVFMFAGSKLATLGLATFGLGVSTMYPAMQGYVLERVEAQVRPHLNGFLHLTGALGCMALVRLSGILAEFNLLLPLSLSLALLVAIALMCLKFSSAEVARVKAQGIYT